MKKKCHDLSVSTPSPSTLSNIERTQPSSLTDKQLVTQYGKLKSAKNDYIHGVLPNSYFRGVADVGGVTGKVPKDVFLFTNLDLTIEEFKNEIKKRNVCYSLIIGTRK